MLTKKQIKTLLDETDSIGNSGYEFSPECMEVLDIIEHSVPSTERDLHIDYDLVQAVIEENKLLKAQLKSIEVTGQIRIEVHIAASDVRLYDIPDGERFNKGCTQYPMELSKVKELVQGDVFTSIGRGDVSEDKLWQLFKEKMYKDTINAIAKGLYTRMDLDKKKPPFPADYVNSLPEELKLKIYRGIL